MTQPKRGGHSLKDTVRWVIGTLVAMCREKAWGEIRITVQAGQIEFVHHHQSYRDRLPNAPSPEADQVVQQLAPAAGGA